MATVDRTDLMRLADDGCPHAEPREACDLPRAMRCRAAGCVRPALGGRPLCSRHWWLVPRAARRKLEACAREMAENPTPEAKRARAEARQACVRALDA